MISFEAMLNPEEHGYAECNHCNGYGSSLKETSDKCTKCGGAGLLKKEEE
jgi:DnaJ-class molecular chaperone